MEHVWVRRTTGKALLKGRGADVWACDGCGCAVRSFRNPVIRDGFVWADVGKVPVRRTEIEDDCELAMVHNVMES